MFTDLLSRAAACTLFLCPEQCLISSVGLPGSEVTIWVEAGYKLTSFVAGRGQITSVCSTLLH